MEKDKNEKFHKLFPKSRGNIISSTLVVPHSFNFASQNENEEVFIVSRRANITNIGWILRSIIGIFIPILFFPLLFDWLQLPFLDTTRILILTFIWYLFIYGYILSNFLNWYFNVYIVTNERILDFDFSFLTGGKISEASLARIEDVTQKQIGFFPTTFNYGDIIIQTAGERLQFRFEKVPNPSWLRDKIVDLSEILVKKEDLDDTN